ncbi:MFS transporter, partial [Candidatus Dojkabacteria bacterium]|nr:MFS transporter [Candidatus Dojkabacteria bacterium]
FSTYIQFFYTDIIKLPASLVGRGWFVFGFWNTFNDPISGRLSDKVKKKFGKRRILINILLIPVIVSFILLWAPRLFENDAKEFFYFLIIISVFDGLYSMLDVNLNAVMPEIYKGLKERTRVTLLKSMLILVFAAFSVGIAPFLYSRLGWFNFGAIIGILGLALYIVSIQGIHEFDERNNEQSVKLTRILKEFFRKKFFVKLVTLQFFIRIVLAIILAVLPFYGKYVLKLSDIESGIMIGAVLGSSLIFLPIWENLTNRLGTKHTMQICLIATFLATLLMFLEVDKYFAIAVLGLVGGLYSGAQSITTVMSTEIVDQDRELEKKNRTGLIYGLMGMANRFPPAIAGLILGELLDIAHYVPDLDPFLQPNTVANYLQSYLIFGILIGLVLAFIINQTVDTRINNFSK